MSGATLGILVATLGAAGFLVALTHRRGLQYLGREHMRLHDRETGLDRREGQLEVDARALYEWEGRLRQVAECGCSVPDRPAKLRRAPEM